MKDPKGRMEQLLQIARGPVWDGNLIDKTATQALTEREYILRVKGWNILSPKGLKVLLDFGLIDSSKGVMK